MITREFNEKTKKIETNEDFLTRSNRKNPIFIQSTTFSFQFSMNKEGELISKTKEHEDHIIDTQVDDSGYWKRADPAGKMRESHRILQENTGKKSEDGSSIPAVSREKFTRKWSYVTKR